MLTSDQTQALITIIEKLEDSPLRIGFIQNLKALVSKGEEIRNTLQ